MNTLTLDTIANAMAHHLDKWSPDLIGTQAYRVLRFVANKLYFEGQGNLRTAAFTLSQSALADKVGLTREWTCKLLARLKEEGWISYHSGRRAGGLRTTCTYTIGNMLRRLLVMLSKSGNSVVKPRSQAFPFSLKKKMPFFPEPNNDLSFVQNGAIRSTLERFSQLGRH